MVAPAVNSPSINEYQTLLLREIQEDEEKKADRQAKVEEESRYGPSKNSNFDENNPQQAVTGSAFVNFLKTNYQFDLVWSGYIISLTGDWLTEIACLTLLGEHGASPLLISLYLLSKELPFSIWAPFTGVVADLFDRRKIMVISDISRMIIVVGYLFIMKMQEGLAWALVGVAFLQTSISSFFQPASASFIPMIVPSEQLIISETLLGATWSTVLLLSAALGGIFSIFFGIAANFVTDSLTYLLSAIILSFLFRYPYKGQTNTSVPPKRNTNNSYAPLDTSQTIENIVQEEEHEKENVTEDKREGGVLLGSIVLWVKMVKNAGTYLRTHKYIFLICLVKFFGTFLWTGYDMVTIEFAQKYFVKGKGGELSLSILYAAGGVGSWLGPFIPTISVSDTSRNNLIAVLSGWWLISIGCFCASFVPNLLFACLASAVRSSGNALLWTYSEVIKDKLVPESMLGRVSAFELALLPIASMISRFGVSWAIQKGTSAFRIAFILGSAGLVMSIIWTIIIVRILKKQR